MPVIFSLTRLSGCMSGIWSVGAVAYTSPKWGEVSGSIIPAVILSLVSLHLSAVFIRILNRKRITSACGWEDLWRVSDTVSPQWNLSLHYVAHKVWTLFELNFASIASAAVVAGSGLRVYYLGLSDSRSLRTGLAWFPFARPNLDVPWLYTRLLNPAPSQKWIHCVPSISCIAMQTTCALLRSMPCTPSQGLIKPLLKSKC